VINERIPLQMQPNEIGYNIVRRVQYGRRRVMIDIDVLKDEIIQRLKPLNPHKIIVFGSMANGSIRADSDIDLFLVMDQYVSGGSQNAPLKGS